MKSLPDLTGRKFGYLTTIERDRTRKGHFYKCKCQCGKIKSVGASSLKTGHTQSCGCYNKERLKEVHTGHSYNVGRPSPFKISREGKRYGKLVVLKDEGNGRWICQCDCGNQTSVLSTNLSCGKTTACRYCSRRKDITGKRTGLLVAIESECGPTNKPPIWLFQCDCGNTIQGTVREFNAGWLRSCGCHGNAHSSWSAMMARCYETKNNRYQHYGRRGIKVCKRWHRFENFIRDIGERPKRHTLSRKNCERDYSPSNCVWEHISKNTADTCYGKPTKPGLRRGAKLRYVR